jgi:hypothetical protein
MAVKHHDRGCGLIDRGIGPHFATTDPGESKPTTQVLREAKAVRALARSPMLDACTWGAILGRPTFITMPCPL